MADEDAENRLPGPSNEEGSADPPSPEAGDDLAEEVEVDADDRDGSGEGPDEAELLVAVRRVAGWRVSPRQLAAALAAGSAVSELEEVPSPDRLAELVDAMRGDRSQRQSRHAELWRALGAELAVRGQPSDPAAQRAFIGEARARSGRWAGDVLLLRITLAVAGSEAEDEGAAEPPSLLEARQVALVARSLRRRFGRRLDQVDMRSGEGSFNDALDEAIDRMRERLSEQADTAELSPREERSRPSRPGGPRDRSRFNPRGGPDRFRGPRKRTHRRAKPAGVSRKPRKKR